MKRVLIGSVLIFATLAPALEAACKEASPSEFANLSREKKHVVFFASWCKSCADHFTDAYAKDSVFVTTYDDGATADKIVKAYLGAKADEVPCVIDKDERLGKFYKVKFLPFVADVKG